MKPASLAIGVQVCDLVLSNHTHPSEIPTRDELYVGMAAHKVAILLVWVVAIVLGFRGQ